jgi:hypothetical protein
MRYSAIGFKAEGRRQRAEVGVFHSSGNRYNSSVIRINNR